MSSTTTVTDTDARFPSLASVKKANNELLNDRNRDGEPEEFLRRITQFLHKAQATGAILNVENERWTCQSILDYWSNYLDRQDNVDLVEETILAPVDDKLIPDIPESKRPYVGLDAFRESKQELFFGREKLVSELVERMKHQRCLFIVGPSGSGKSSVVMAGLIPQLKAGAVTRSEKWQYFPPIVPGFDPLASLVSIVDPPGTRPENWVQQEAAKFKQNRNHLLEMVNGKNFETALIVIDQFEEIFTLTTDESVRLAFINNLLSLIDYPDLNHRIILTMRSDFETFLTKIPELYAQFQDNSVRITPLSALEIQEAIQKPADIVGLRFEDGIVDELVKETVAETNGLPLLQFSLLKLWNHRRNNLVTWQAFQQVGSCREALTRSADDFYARLSAADQSRVKWILLRLVRPGTGLEVYSNRIPRSNLYSSPGDREHVDRVLNGLIEAGLVRETEGNAPGELKVEVAHEALVRHWRRLVSWLDEERVNVRRRLSLTEAAVRWDASGRESSALLRGSMLTEALRFEKLNQVEEAFVQASLNRRKLSSQLLLAGGAAVVICAVVAVFYFSARATAAGEEAQNALSRELAAKALVNKDSLDLALLLAMQAFNTRDTPEARQSLGSLLSQPATANLVAYLDRTKQPVRVLSLVDENTLRGLSNDGVIYTWNPGAPGLAPSEVSTGVSRAGAVALAGPVCALATLGGDIVIANSTTGKEIKRLKMTESADEIALSADGRILAAAASMDESVYLWKVETGELLSRIPPEEKEDFPIDVTELALTKNGNFLAYTYGGFGEEVRLFDVEKKRQVHKLTAEDEKGTSDYFYALAFNDDGTILATESDNGLTLWNTVDGKQVTKWVDRKSEKSTPLLFANNNRLLWITDEGDIAVFDFVKVTNRWPRRPSKIIKGLPGELLAATVGGKDGKLLSGSTPRGNVILWDLDTTRDLRTKLVDTESAAIDVAVSPDGTMITYAGLTNYEKPLAVLVDLASGLKRMSFSPPDNALPPDFVRGINLTYTQDGYLLVGLIASQSRKFAVWQLKTNEVFMAPTAEDELIRQVKISPDGKTVALVTQKVKGDSPSYIGTEKSLARLVLWKFGSQEPLTTLIDAFELPSAVSFSFDGKSLAFADKNNRIILWDPQSGKKLNEVSLPPTESDDDLSLSSTRMVLGFSPDGKILVLTSRTRALFYNLATQSITDRPIEDYAEGVFGIEFTRDSKRMAVVSREQRIGLWDVETQREIGTIAGEFHTKPVFSPNGSSLILGRGRALYSWDININSWLDRGCAIANRNLTQSEWERFVGKTERTKTCQHNQN